MGKLCECCNILATTVLLRPYIYIVGGLRVASSRIMCLLTTPGGHLLEYQTGMHVTKLMTSSHITSVLYNLSDDQNLPQ